MTDPKTTPLQAVLRILKAPDADAAQQLLELLDSRYVRIEELPSMPSGSSNGAYHVPDGRVRIIENVLVTAAAEPASPLGPGYVSIGFDPPFDAAPVAIVAAEVNSAGKPGHTATKPGWDRRTLEEFLRVYNPSQIAARILADDMAAAGYDKATLDAVVQNFLADNNSTAREAASLMLSALTTTPAALENDKLLTALVSELDAICGPDELVDCNLEKPVDYLDALRMLIEMAKRCKSYETRQPIATDQWTNGLHKPTLEAVAELIGKRAASCEVSAVDRAARCTSPEVAWSKRKQSTRLLLAAIERASAFRGLLGDIEQMQRPAK